MINHLRNLLLGVPGSINPGPSFPGEQFVPPLFSPVPLPAPLLTIRNALFTDRPDRAMLNWRIQEYLSCVHGSGLGGFVTALDPRITYWPFNRSLLTSLLFGPQAVQFMGNPAQQLFFVGAQSGQVQPSWGRLFYSWQLTIVDNTTVQIVLYNDLNQLETTTTASYTVSNNLSSPVTLPGTQLQVLFMPGVGTGWNIQVLTQPAQKMVDVITAIQNNLNDLINTNLFPAGSAEPYATFGNLWNESNQLPLRVGGLILGLGYAIDNLEK